MNAVSVTSEKVEILGEELTHPTSPKQSKNFGEKQRRVNNNLLMRHLSHSILCIEVRVNLLNTRARFQRIFVQLKTKHITETETVGKTVNLGKNKSKA